MKNIILPGLLALSFNTFAQDASEGKTLALKINPLPCLIDNNSNESYYLFSSSFKINAEKSIGANKSFVFELGFAGPITFDIENGEAGENIATTGFTSAFGNKFYLSPSASMSGMYVLPTLSYSFIKLLEHPEGMPRTGYVGFKDMGVSGILGYQAIGKKNWVIDIYSGVQMFQRNYYDNTFMESTEVINHNEIGMKPVLGISFGKLF